MLNVILHQMFYYNEVGARRLIRARTDMKGVKRILPMTNFKITAASETHALPPRSEISSNLLIDRFLN